ncbi:MAG TPA: IS66 family transposase, partial [Candidatus Saccharimonadales bacterium]
MAKKLSEAEIDKRLVRLTNLERLHVQDQRTKAGLRARIKQLESERAEDKAYFQSIIETQAAQIAELQTMVFGRKNRFRSGGKRPPTGKPRDAASYRRPTPPENEITAEEHHAVAACNHCGGPLVDKETYTRYVEDIILAALDNLAKCKTATKHTIERGYCIPCGKYSSALDLRGQDVSLGPVVRSYICYLVTLMDHSYAQVSRALWDIYHLKVSEGEITAILDDRRRELLPEYEKLKDSIRASPAVHMDESRWRIQSEHSGYAWSSSTTSTDVVFKLADSRGMGNAEELLGADFKGIGITDRYRGYKFLFCLHQICWAHLQRTAKDLTHLSCLTKTKQKHVTTFYQKLAVIYATIRKYQAEPFDAATRNKQAKDLLKQVTTLCQPHDRGPKKLQDLKAGILEYGDCLFVCLTVDGIPADNNRAERDIRQLVMKRRKSLGSKTPKGARTMEVLLSVC